MKKLFTISFCLLSLAYSQRLTAQCSTTTSTPTGVCGSGDMIDAFTLNSIASTGSNNSCASTSSGYIFLSTPVWNLDIGQTYSFSASVGGVYGFNQGFAIWIDLNSNGNYENSEMVYTSASTSTSHSGSISIPSTATPGTNVRMRLRCAYATTITSGQACTNNINTYGETEDHLVNLVAPCPAPSFTSQPSNQQGVCEGGNASFAVAATNASGGYQWQIKSGSAWNNISNGANYSGATTNNLTVTTVPQSFTGNLYRCVATGGCNNPKNSDSAVITVNPGVTVTADPVSDTLCRGASASFNVAAAGSVAGYEWQMAMPTVGVFYPVPNAFPFANVNTATLDILNTPDTLDGYLFRCSVSGGICPSDISEGASLTVLVAPEITEPPVNVTANLHNDAYFSIKASDPSVVYYWQASADGISFYNINNGPLYQNVTTPMLIVKGVTLAQAGWWFRCIIKATDPACGTFRDTSDAAQLKVHWPQGINDITAGNMVSVYPNPVSGDHLFVQPNEAIPGKLRATIIDKLGRAVYSTEIEFSGTKEVSIPVNQLPAGVYSLHLINGDGSINTSAKFGKQ